jgi:GYF domain 2
MGDAVWWYERNGQQAGPVTLAELLELSRSGQLRPEARVWRAGMPGWLPARDVPEVAAGLPAGEAVATAPAPFQAPASTAIGSGGGGGGLPRGMEPTSTGAVIGLGLITLGIYPMVKFYQAGMAYEELAGRRSRFALYFWLSIGLALLGGPLHALGGVPGFASHVAALVFTILTLFEALALRAEVVRRYGVSPVLTPDTTHKALFIIGLFTSWLVIGIVLLVVQAVKFFADHRALRDALRAKLGAPGAIATSAPA